MKMDRREAGMFSESESQRSLYGSYGLEERQGGILILYNSARIQINTPTPSPKHAYKNQTAAQKRKIVKSNMAPATTPPLKMHQDSNS